MSPEVLEIFADEAWTHSGDPLRRYWCFLAGVFGSKGDLDRLEKQLASVKLAHGYRTEAKWGKLGKDGLGCFTEMVDCFFAYLEKYPISYRQMFLDRSYIHYETYQEDPNDLYNLSVQFKLYYQFIKHHFGIQYIPKRPQGTLIYLRLDDHSSQKHKEKLEAFVTNLPRILDRPDIAFRVSFLNSASSCRIQICDLLMGAAGSYGNQMQDIRIDGRRGMTEKQKVRVKFCKHVYEHMKRLSCTESGARAFNWFENTGTMTPAERYSRKVRIWKFVPRTYLKDKGWERQSLGSDGSYLGPQIDFQKVFGLQSDDDDWADLPKERSKQPST